MTDFIHFCDLTKCKCSKSCPLDIVCSKYGSIMEKGKALDILEKDIEKYKKIIYNLQKALDEIKKK